MSIALKKSNRIPLIEVMTLNQIIREHLGAEFI